MNNSDVENIFLSDLKLTQNVLKTKSSKLLNEYLLKKNRVYLVDYIDKRPTKLNGTINIKACLEEIKQIMN